MHSIISTTVTCCGWDSREIAVDCGQRKAIFSVPDPERHSSPHSLPPKRYRVVLSLHVNASGCENLHSPLFNCEVKKMRGIKRLNFHIPLWLNVYRIDGTANVSHFLKSAKGNKF